MSDLAELKRIVCEANFRIVREGLVLLIWGNVSAVDRESDLRKHGPGAYYRQGKK